MADDVNVKGIRTMQLAAEREDNGWAMVLRLDGDEQNRVSFKTLQEAEEIIRSAIILAMPVVEAALLRGEYVSLEYGSHVGKVNKKGMAPEETDCPKCCSWPGAPCFPFGRAKNSGAAPMKGFHKERIVAARALASARGEATA